METPTGWLYAITCGIYEAAARASSKDHPYVKLGYITMRNATAQGISKILMARYGTSLIDPRVLFVVQVCHPRMAETELFKLLQDYRVCYNREIFCAGFEPTILPAMRQIAHESQTYEIVEEAIIERKIRPQKPDVERLLGLVRNQINVDHERVCAAIASNPKLVNKLSNICCALELAESHTWHQEKLDVVREVVTKLGIRIFDNTTLIPRGTFDADIPGWEALLKRAWKIFGKRDRTSSEQMDMKIMFKRLNGILREYADVRLEAQHKDENRHVSSYKIKLGDFATLFNV